MGKEEEEATRRKREGGAMVVAGVGTVTVAIAGRVLIPEAWNEPRKLQRFVLARVYGMSPALLFCFVCLGWSAFVFWFASCALVCSVCFGLLRVFWFVSCVFFHVCYIVCVASYVLLRLLSAVVVQYVCVYLSCSAAFPW